jgi:hypothetical protein
MARFGTVLTRYECVVLHRHLFTKAPVVFREFQPIKTLLASPGETDKSFPVWKKVLAGTLAGAISSSLCNPTDLLKVRLQADTGKGGARYKGLGDALVSIVKSEGVLGLYRGVGTTFDTLWLLTLAFRCIVLPCSDGNTHFVAGLVRVLKALDPHPLAHLSAQVRSSRAGLSVSRSCVFWIDLACVAVSNMFSASELATYDEIKHQLVTRGIVSSGSSLSGHVLASLAAGAISTVAINPFDVAKRYM